MKPHPPPAPAIAPARRLPAAGLLLAASAGVLLSPFLPAFFLSPVAVLLPCAAVPFLALRFLDRAARSATALVWIALFLLAASLAARRSPPPVPSLDPSSLYSLAGTVASSSPLAPDRVRLAPGARLGGVELDVPVLLFYDPAVTGFLPPGCSVRAPVKALSLASSERGLLFRCLSPPVCTGTLPPSPLSALRLRLETLLASSLPPAPAGLAAAVSLGSRAGLDPAWRTAFRRSGNAHLLAVSGLHAGMVVLLALLVGRILLLERRARWRLAALLSLAWLVLVGFAPPASRAVLMVLAVLVSVSAGRPVSPLNSLCLAALVIVLLSPTALRDASFQLSFSAVAGILLLGLPLVRLVPRPGPFWSPYRRLPAAAARPTALAFGAWAFTTPLVWYHFGMVTPFAFLSSLVTVPLLALLLLSVLFLFATAALGFPLAAPAAFAAKLLALACGLTAALPGSWAALAPPPVWLALLWLSALFAAALFLGFRPRLAVLAALAVLCLAVFRPAPPEGRFALSASPFTEAVSRGGACVLLAPGDLPPALLLSRARKLGLPPPSLLLPLSPLKAPLPDGLSAPLPIAGARARCGPISARCLSPPLAGGLPLPLPVRWLVRDGNEPFLLDGPPPR